MPEIHELRPTHPDIDRLLDRYPYYRDEMKAEHRYRVYGNFSPLLSIWFSFYTVNECGEDRWNIMDEINDLHQLTGFLTLRQLQLVIHELSPLIGRPPQIRPAPLPHASA